ncbi:MAG: division/cell wall cluster transcriptional repressor MraZ [Sedimentisphaeraceae bacterium JB056]
MDALITGDIKHSIDSSNRLFVSKKLRSQMGGDEAGLVVYLVPGVNSAGALYTEQAFRRYVYSTPVSEMDDPVAYERMMFSMAHKFELDKSGRIQLTEELINLYDFKDNLSLLGVGDHIEIWNTDDWYQYRKEQFAKFQKQTRAARSRTFETNRKEANSLASSSKESEG